MADTPVNFRVVPEQENPSGVPLDGTITVKIGTVNDVNRYRAELKWDGKTYVLLPEYNWAGIKDDFINDNDITNKIKELAEAAVETNLNVSWLNYLDVERKDINGNTTLNFRLREGTPIVDENGLPVTTASITSGTENGTFLVNDTPIRIAGLGSAAYTESDDYTQMSVSHWTDWQDISAGGGN